MRTIKFKVTNKKSGKTAIMQLWEMNEADSEADIIRQFTGLKDNTKWEQLTKKEQSDWLKENKKEEWDGKEIYEGDIVTSGYSYHDELSKKAERIKKKRTGTVGFIASSFNLIEYAMYLGNLKDLEVIGNIVENKELLKGKHE